MKVAIYVRVSRSDLNLDNQKIPLIEYAKRQGWDYEIFEETQTTRKTRPIQWELYNRLLKKEFDILLFYRLDRWARSLSELVRHIESLLEKGIKIISYTENIDYSTSMGKLIFHQLGAFAQFERDLIKERTLAGLERAKAKGKKLGRPKGSKQKKLKSIDQRKRKQIENIVKDVLKEKGVCKQ